MTLFSLLVAACSDAPDAPGDPVVQAWSEACVRVSGCEPYASTADPVFTCSAAMTTFAGAEPADCALESSTCDDAVACFGAGAPPSVCATGTDAHCDGDVLRECDSGLQLQIARDCAAESLACRINSFGDAECARPGECAEGVCDGVVPVNCFGGIPVPGAPCPSRCVAESGFASCAGEGEACDAPLYRCDGDVAVSCRSGFVHREQCAPGACRDTDGAFCASTEGCAPRCDGTAFVTCEAGAEVRYDCAAWGFAGCTDDPPRCT